MDTGEPIVRGLLVVVAIGAAALSVAWAQDTPPGTDRPTDAVAVENTPGSGQGDLIGDYAVTGDPWEVIDETVPQGIDTPRMAVLQPGQRWHLVRRVSHLELLNDNRPDVTEGTSVYTLDVDRGAQADSLTVRMGAHRWWGERHVDGRFESRYDSENTPAENVPVIRWFKMRHYAGQIDALGRVTSFGLAELSDPGGEATGPEMWTDRSRAYAMRTFLCDLLAYAPPVGADEGDTWMVTRPRVVLLSQRAITFLTGGATALAEQSTCTLEEIQVDGDQRIGVISISSFRELIYEPQLCAPNLRDIRPAEGADRTNSTITSGGELKIDMDTGRIIQLQLNTEFLPDERCMNYVDTRNQRYLLNGRGLLRLALTADITLEPVPATDASDEDDIERTIMPLIGSTVPPAV